MAVNVRLSKLLYIMISVFRLMFSERSMQLILFSHRLFVPLVPEQHESRW